MILGTVRISKQGVYNNSVNIYFDKNAGKLIDEYIVIDKINMKFRNSTIDDKKTYKATLRKDCTSRQTGAKFTNCEDVIGYYEVELTECGKWYQMFKI